LIAEDDTETLRMSRVVPAPQAKVFRAWTEPELMKRWWSIGEGWTTSTAEVDLRVGGRYSLLNHHDGGDELKITGEFQAIEPPRRLVYTWRFPGSLPVESLVTVEFHQHEAGTEVVVKHERSPKAMGPGAIAGWNAALARLATFLAIQQNT